MEGALPYRGARAQRRPGILPAYDEPAAAGPATDADSAAAAAAIDRVDSDGASPPPRLSSADGPAAPASPAISQAGSGSSRGVSQTPPGAARPGMWVDPLQGTPDRSAGPASPAASPPGAASASGPGDGGGRRCPPPGAGWSSPALEPPHGRAREGLAPAGAADGKVLEAISRCVRPPSLRRVGAAPLSLRPGSRNSPNRRGRRRRRRSVILRIPSEPLACAKFSGTPVPVPSSRR